MTPPRVFLSYSHDSPDHRMWVLKLATDLRGNSIDVTLDQWDLSPGQDIVEFMQRGISDSDRVVLVCSEQYVRNAEAGSGGVGYERLIVTAELVGNTKTNKFIPIIRNGGGSGHRVPSFLGPRLYLDFSSDGEYESSLEELSREILGVPKTSKPPLGLNPFLSPAKRQRDRGSSYVVVVCREPREVFIDGQSQGDNITANGRPRVLFVPPGFHTFRLGGYASTQTVDVPATPIIAPFRVEFRED